VLYCLRLKGQPLSNGSHGALYHTLWYFSVVTMPTVLEDGVDHFHMTK
jgi:hypothetical protein